mmetsp:Transcript_46922/g.133888  ORF Transcript_46922/g.133888 Transcript_46922/m.133888 type:complete len:236 (+) Transcript_46922:427-1134(+)
MMMRTSCASLAAPEAWKHSGAAGLATRENRVLTLPTAVSRRPSRGYALRRLQRADSASLSPPRRGMPAACSSATRTGSGGQGGFGAALRGHPALASGSRPRPPGRRGSAHHAAPQRRLQLQRQGGGRSSAKKAGCWKTSWSCRSSAAACSASCSSSAFCDRSAAQSSQLHLLSRAPRYLLVRPVFAAAQSCHPNARCIFLFRLSPPPMVKTTSNDSRICMAACRCVLFMAPAGSM